MILLETASCALAFEIIIFLKNKDEIVNINITKKIMFKKSLKFLIVSLIIELIFFGILILKKIYNNLLIKLNLLKCLNNEISDLDDIFYNSSQYLSQALLITLMIRRKTLLAKEHQQLEGVLKPLLYLQIHK